MILQTRQSADKKVTTEAHWDFSQCAFFRLLRGLLKQIRKNFADIHVLACEYVTDCV